MGNITVNEFNSKNKGGLSMSQYCGNCYQTDASGAYVPVNCQTGEPLNGPDGPDNGKKDDDTKPWWKKKVVLITVVILILAIVVFLGFWYSMHHKAKSVPTQVQTFDDYYYY
jgi:F0F1-type ATP synthase membrane subunit a